MMFEPQVFLNHKGTKKKKKHEENKNHEMHIIYLATLIFNCSLAQKILRIDIHSIPMMTETDMNVSCDGMLEMSFDKVVPKKITESKALSDIQKMLLLFKLNKEKPIDVRGQILIL